MALYGDLMGWNCDPTAANVNLAKNAGTKWIRWGPELPWYLSNPADHTRDRKSTRLNSSHG